MARVVRCGLIQAKTPLDGRQPLSAIKKAMIDKHLKMIEQAAKKSAKSSASRNCSTARTSAPSRTPRWYELTETHSRRSDHQADAENRREAQDGDRRADI